MIDLVLGAIVGLTVCQEPVRLDAGVGRSLASEQWIVSPVEECRPSSLKVFKLEVPSEALGVGTIKPNQDVCGAKASDKHEVVYFASGSAEVPLSEVTKILELTHETPNHLTIVGYTDSRGSLALNTKLANARSRAVWNLWKRMGGPMPSDGVQLRGRPLCCYAEVQDRSRNRRVTITVKSEEAGC